MIELLDALPSPQLNPESSNPAASVLDTPGLWWLVQLSFRKEIEVAADLVHLGHACYLPISFLTSTYANRTRYTRAVPLFPGYAFLNIGPDAAHPSEAMEAALRLRRLGRGVIGVVEVKQSARLHQELKQIEAALAINPAMAAEQLEVGQECRVTAGPFRDFKGRLTEVGRRFVLPVSMMGRQVPLEISLEWLEPV